MKFWKWLINFLKYNKLYQKTCFENPSGQFGYAFLSGKHIQKQSKKTTGHTSEINPV